MSQHLCHAPRPGRAHGLVGLATLFFLLWIFPATPTLAAWSNGNWTEVFSSWDTIDNFVVSSDGVEGTVVMYLDSSNYPLWTYISHLSRTGTKTWGDAGVRIPINMVATTQDRPIAVTSDGNGGAYCVVTDVYSADDVIRLMHYDASGIVTWSLNVAGVHDRIQGNVQLVCKPGTGVTVGYHAAANDRLSAVRYDTDGNQLWTADANLYYHNI